MAGDAGSNQPCSAVAVFVRHCSTLRLWSAIVSNKRGQSNNSLEPFLNNLVSATYCKSPGSLSQAAGSEKKSHVRHGSLLTFWRFTNLIIIIIIIIIRLLSFDRLVVPAKHIVLDSKLTS